MNVQVDRRRYKISDIAANRFYQLPKFLFEGEFKDLSNDARVLYSLLKDRHELSLQNNWVNDEGEVYLIYSRDEMCGTLGLSEKTVTKAVKHLKDLNLMSEERLGLGNPNRIYLHAVVNNEIPGSVNIPVQAPQMFRVRPANNTAQDAEDFQTNDTYIKETNYSDTDINQSILSAPIGTRTGERMIDRIDGSQTEYIAIVKKNIDYDHLMRDRQRFGGGELDEMLNIIVDVMCTNRPAIRINGEDKPSAHVKGQLLKLDSNHIEYVSDCLSNTTTKISNIRAYLLSALYNAPSSINHYYRALVNHDLSKENV